MSDHALYLRVNGVDRASDVPPGLTLLEFLREYLGLTGTKYNCEQGECGACTVLLDGRAVDSCLVLALSASGGEVTTIEGLGSGLGSGAGLDPVQAAFVRADAAQCGYCTPGMVMAVKALLADAPDPTPAEIERGLEGNYCRCTGYEAIVDAVLRVAAAAPKEAP
jgi:carbon-monoxide dehydrogenase small subunit